MPKMDIIFVLDTSKSIGNKSFGVMKNFVKNTASLVKVNLSNSLIAVILFAENALIQFSLTKHTNIDSFQQAVDSIKYEDEQGSYTNTPAVLNLLQTAGENGSLGLRDDTIKVVFVITDGRPNLPNLNKENAAEKTKEAATEKTKEAAARLHESGIYDHIYSIGIEANKPIGKSLYYIAYPPLLVFHLLGFDEILFQQITGRFITSLCTGECLDNYCGNLWVTIYRSQSQLSMV